MEAFWNDAWRSCADGERCELLARYIVMHGATVRTAAKYFGISKSTVHKEISTRLRAVNPGLYSEARLVLDKNKAERHLRGGEATRKRYQGLKNASFNRILSK